MRPLLTAISSGLKKSRTNRRRL